MVTLVFDPFGNYDPQIKIIIFSLFAAAVFVTFVLGIVLVSVWMIESRRTRRKIRQYQAEILAENNNVRRDRLRRSKEREARRTLSDRNFDQQLREMLSQ